MTFGVSGKLFKDSMVMYDHQTGSLWCQATGVAIAGRLRGVKLKPLPAVLTSWQMWLRDVPQSSVLSKRQSPYQSYAEDHMSDYYSSDRTGLRTVKSSRGYLSDKEKVLGFVGKDRTVAYPYSLLRQAGLLHDQFNGLPVVIFFNQESDTPSLFTSRLQQQELNFTQKAGQFTDDQTGSTWSGVNGRALSGPLEGCRLKPLVGWTSFWFAWKEFHPDGTIFSLKIKH